MTVPTISLGALWFVATISETKFAVMPMMMTKQMSCKIRMNRKLFAKGGAPYVGTGILGAEWWMSGTGRRWDGILYLSDESSG